MSTIEQRAAALMRDEKFEEAASLLIKAREEARQKGDVEDAGYWGSLLGSCFMASGRDDEALEAYKQAEDDNPDDPFLSLELASFLVNVMKNPEAAIPRLEASLPKLAPLRSSHHAGLAVLGTAFLAQDRIQDAKRTFQEMADPKLIDGLIPPSLDLTLAERLVERGESLEECRQYLLTVLERATSQKDHAVASRVSRLLGTIHDIA